MMEPEKKEARPVAAGQGFKERHPKRLNYRATLLMAQISECWHLAPHVCLLIFVWWRG